MDDLSSIRAFVTVARTGSVGLAALELHLSQASVSRQLQRLEAALRAKLFERRDGRALELTVPGRRLLEPATGLLDEADRRWGRLRALALERHERLAVGLGPGMMALPEAVEAMARFRIEHPGVDSSVSEHIDSTLVLRDLLAGDVDIAISPIRAQDRSDELVIIDILPLALHVLVGHGHRLADRAVVTVADLAGEIFAFRAGSDGMAAFRTVCRRAGVEPRIDHMVEDTLTLIAMITTGEAINVGFADRPVVPGPMAAAFRLVPLLVDHPPEVVAAVFWRRDRPPAIPGSDFAAAALDVAEHRDANAAGVIQD